MHGEAEKYMVGVDLNPKVVPKPAVCSLMPEWCFSGSPTAGEKNIQLLRTPWFHFDIDQHHY